MIQAFAKHPGYVHSFPTNAVAAQKVFMTQTKLSDVVVWLAGDGSGALSGNQIPVRVPWY